MLSHANCAYITSIYEAHKCWKFLHKQRCVTFK